MKSYFQSFAVCFKSVFVSQFISTHIGWTRTSCRSPLIKTGLSTWFSAQLGPPRSSNHKFQSNHPTDQWFKFSMMSFEYNAARFHWADLVVEFARGAFSWHASVAIMNLLGWALWILSRMFAGCEGKRVRKKLWTFEVRNSFRNKFGPEIIFFHFVFKNNIIGNANHDNKGTS